VINTRTHASLVEVAHRARRTLEWAQQQAREGRIAAVRTADGFLVSFADGGRSVATMSKVWYWVDKTTGEAQPLGGGLVSKLADSLRPLDL